VVVPYLTTTWSTYTMLSLLVFLHLLINYAGVRGVMLRTLNRQRASLAWAWFRRLTEGGDAKSGSRAPSPSEIMEYERLFSRPDLLWSSAGSQAVGRCTIGSSVGSVYDNASASHLPPSRLLESFQKELFVIWFDPRSLLSSTPSSKSQDKPTFNIKTFPHIHIFLKEGHASSDQLKAWLISCEVSLLVTQLRDGNGNKDTTREGEKLFVEGTRNALDAVELVLQAQKTVENLFLTFIEKMLKAEWCADTQSQSRGSTGDGGEEEDIDRRSSRPCLAAALMTCPPKGVIVDVVETQNEKKTQ
jgi:hypothetical protein